MDIAAYQAEHLDLISSSPSTASASLIVGQQLRVIGFASHPATVEQIARLLDVLFPFPSSSSSAAAPVPAAATLEWRCLIAPPSSEVRQLCRDRSPRPVELRIVNINEPRSYRKGDRAGGGHDMGK